MINPSSFTSIGVMKAYTFTKGDAGGLTASIAESKTVWCKVESTAGSTNPTQGQIKSDADYKITMRYDPAFTTNWIFLFDGMHMKIKSIDNDNEAYKRFIILYCSVSLDQQSWS